MSMLRTALVYLVSVGTISSLFCVDAGAKALNHRTKQLLGEKPMDSKPESKSKSLTFEQTGGFVSIHKRFEKRFADMPAAESKELEKLIVESGLATAKSGEHKSGGADMFEYDFTFHDGTTPHHVVFDDGTLPKSYGPLVKYLSSRLVNQRK